MNGLENTKVGYTTKIPTLTPHYVKFYTVGHVMWLVAPFFAKKKKKKNCGVRTECVAYQKSACSPSKMKSNHQDPSAFRNHTRSRANTQMPEYILLIMTFQPHWGHIKTSCTEYKKKRLHKPTVALSPRPVNGAVRPRVATGKFCHSLSPGVTQLHGKPLSHRHNYTGQQPVHFQSHPHFIVV